MGDALWKRLQLLVSVLSVLLVLALLFAGWCWWRLHASLPALDGKLTVAGLAAPVQITRDALGVPTVAGASRIDVARATGFLHAQDRFFQMDLLRRSGAGEVAELFGPAAVPFDRSRRLHGFRRIAEQALARLTPERRALLIAYTEGINAGLTALPASPWEYLALRSQPRPWQPEDCFLAVYAMWFDLQDSTGHHERNLDALRETIGTAGANFFAPRGTSWDAALDGGTLPAPPLPPLRLRAPEEKTTVAFPLRPARLPVGSNNFAVSGAHTAGGGAMLASDMHLGLNVPNVWYRAMLVWTDDRGTAHRLVGVTLPGMPFIVSGSNGEIAWGYTNSYIDTTDVVTLETENTARAFYRTAQGYREIIDRTGTIAVRGEEPVTFVARWTEWGPIVGTSGDGHYLVLRWNAHDPEATDTVPMELETATNVAGALAIGHRAGMPNQNLLVADRTGAIGWTLTGRIPRRFGHDGRYPVSWAYGDRRWDGWLADDEVPAIVNPADGFLWTANQRTVSGEAYAKLGDGGYYNGARAQIIRDDLRQLVDSGKKITPADLLAIQLDDRTVFLDRWQKLLLKTLTDEAVAKKKSRLELRTVVAAWSGHASADSAAYRLVKLWHQHVEARVFAPFFEQAAAVYPGFYSGNFQSEDALWQLVQEQPVRLLNPAHTSWESLLLAAADDVVADADRAGLAPARLTNGRENTLRMQHPFSRFLPRMLASLIDMPAQPLPGGSDMPRIQSANAGASERLVVSPGREDEALFHMPGGQSGHPLSSYYRAGHEAWVKGEPTPLLPGPTEHTLVLQP
ncbi:MAG: Acyl-homoserine lactone acylase QuiP precursor [Verrucomicrobiota bacterium]